MRCRDGQVIRRGDHVVCDREAPAQGTWPAYAGRQGWVVVIKERDGEVGPAWSLPKDVVRAEASAWFLPSEIVKVRETPHKASQGPANE